MLPDTEGLHTIASTDSSDVAPSPGGGAVAIRGFLVQTLVVILEATANADFKEITLEPHKGGDQFDFTWLDSRGWHATQVKTSKNNFTLTDAKNWAAKMEAEAKNGEQCTLMLIGSFESKLANKAKIGAVNLVKRNLELGVDHKPADAECAEVEQAAHKLSKFLEDEKLPQGAARDREMLIHALTSKLQHYATKSAPLTRDAFRELLRIWLKSPMQGAVLSECAYPRVVEKLSDILQQNPALKEFLQQAAPSLFDNKTLAKTLGCQRLDIKPVLDAVLEKLPSRPPDKAFAEALDLGFGCLLALAVDPAWVARQREEGRTRELSYPGGTFDKAFGSQSINYLNLVLRAVADKECGFEELFIASSESDERRVPGLAELMRGIRPDDVQTELKYTMTEFMFGMVQRIQKGKPNLRDIEQLFDELREQMADAYLNDRPFHATDPSFEPYVDMLKKDLRLGSLLLVFPRGGSETEIVDKAHLLITRLHALRGQLQRLRRISNT